MLIGFKAQFADAVESGEKRQTIRALRKDGRVPKVGERLYLYTGLRQPGCRKLGEGIVTYAAPIHLERPDCTGERSTLDGNHMFSHELDEVAKLDGFEKPAAWMMFQWFEDTHGLPFAGTLIRWRLVPREEWSMPAQGAG